MKVIVTIPAYNEEKTIGKVIRSISSVMKKHAYDYEIIVIDDGSKDRTSSIAKKEGAKIFSHPYNFGLAEAFRTEIKKCLELGAGIIVHTDADGQYLASDIPKLINKIKEGNDLVLGSRFKGKIESMPLIKRLGNIAFSKVISAITRKNISDGQTGFRAFTKEVASSIQIISNHTYTQEQIIKAAQAKFKISEIPIYFAKRDGKSRLISNPFEYAAKAMVNLFRIYRDYTPLMFFGSIGLSFIFIGFLIGLFLVYNFIKTGLVGHVPLAILTVLIIISGIQMLFFGFLADMKR